MPPFTEETTLGFRYFMQTLVFHVVSGPRVLNIMDDDDRDGSLFWDSCCSRLLIDYMTYPVSVPSHASLHPVLESNWNALVSAANRSAFVAVLRDAFVSGGLDGLETLNSSLSSVRRIVRLSVSATRVLGCSVQEHGMKHSAGDDLLLGTKMDYFSGAVKPFRMHVITPAVLLTKQGKLVSKRLYLATHEEWSRVFGYNPLFSKDASRAFSAPKFSSHDWRMFCMLAVMSVQGRTSPQFEERSREFLACSAFASAVSQRTYATGMGRCFDLPPQKSGFMRYAVTTSSDFEYFERCMTLDGDEVMFEDDPWKLRQLASAVQAVLLERWDLQQVLLPFVRIYVFSYLMYHSLLQSVV
jgi:hypothetical protein